MFSVHWTENIMKKPNIHIVPSGDAWAVKKEGQAKPVAETRTQAEATRIGREIARESEVEILIHRPNGQIRDRDSYGNDPCPPKDKD
jgi:hypothetical protein